MRLPKRINNIGQCRNPHVFGIIYRRQYSERRKITTIILFAKEPSSTKAYGEVFLEEAMGQTFLNRMRDDHNTRMQYMAELRIENKTKHQR